MGSDARVALTVAINPLSSMDTVLPYLIDIVSAVVLLVLTVVVAGWARRATQNTLERSNVDATLTRFFGSFARYAVLVLGVLTVLSVFGLSIASFAAVLAGAAFAVGLALQGTLSHFAAGVMLLIFRPFGTGDKVSVAGITGSVVEVGLFATLFDTPDNRRIIVPNGSIFGSTIENMSHHHTRRVDVSVGTDYTADLGATRQVLEQVATSTEGGLDDPSPQVYLSELGASSIDWSVRVWAPADAYWSVRERLTNAIKTALDEHEIGIPYPQMDVHVDSLVASDGAELGTCSERAGASH